jgi:Heterokaryon incompatibility protein (HET)
VTTNLNNKPVYEALSYYWEAPDNSESLQLPEGQLPIMANLAAGLRQLRFSDRSRRLWVDAICINQKDNDEKGPQGALMTQLDRDAECVVI